MMNHFIHVGRDGKVPIALYQGEKALVSSAYETFEVKDTSKILPEYLFLWFKRSEFDREATFYASAGIRGGFDWEDFINMEISVPSIEEQRRIVAEYQTVERRIKNNEALIQKLEETAQAIYHHTFVEGIDENNLPEGWRMGCLGDVCEYVKEKVSTNDISEQDYISTEDILKDKKGISKSSNLPEDTNVTKYAPGDILVSNIRPYYKKIWLTTKEGGCSTDVLCYRASNDSRKMFVYYTLYDDKFFEYVVAGCKGTKMPRGDKDWNMKYKIVIPSDNDFDDYTKKTEPLVSLYQNISRELTHLRKLQSLLTSKLA